MTALLRSARLVARRLPLVLLCAAAIHAETIPGLGSAAFATTTHSAEAQHAFIRGLLLLHLFEYRDAANSFVAAEQLDPGFAMAYWGEAMTFNHPVWNQLDVRAGRAALDKFAATPAARAQRISNARERAWMNAVEILYSDSGTKRERDAHYAAAMQRLSQAYPKDDEAQLFYALALLGESEGVRDVPVYLRAAAIAKAVFARNPHHPGAAHYWIHGMDDPQHAAGALVAARALSKIAPDAGHAQHMCSHIFVAMGMWDDVVQANLAATRVVNEQLASAGKPPSHCGHYNYWLEYGYLQQGRINDAKHVLAGCRDQAIQSVTSSRERDATDPDDAIVASFVEMRSRYLIDTARWHDEITAWHVELAGSLLAQFEDTFATGFAAAHTGDPTASERALPLLQALLPQLPALFDRAGVPPDDPARHVPEIENMQLEAALLASKGQTDQAIATARNAIASENTLAYAFGPPSPVKPSEELLGDLLLAQRDYSRARIAFESALRRAPQRTQSLLGLARAQAALGEDAAAATTRSQLARIWRNADPDYAPAAELRQMIAPSGEAAH